MRDLRIRSEDVGYDYSEEDVVVVKVATAIPIAEGSTVKVILNSMSSLLVIAVGVVIILLARVVRVLVVSEICDNDDLGLDSYDMWR